MGGEAGREGKWKDGNGRKMLGSEERWEGKGRAWKGGAWGGGGGQPRNFKRIC